jgi:hypothetical protein
MKGNGRAIHQVVSHVGFVVNEVALWQVFPEYVGLTYQFWLPQTLHNNVSPGAGTIGQLVADVTSGLILTQHQEIN